MKCRARVRDTECSNLRRRSRRARAAVHWWTPTATWSESSHGPALQLPGQQRTPNSRTVVNLDPKERIRASKTGLIRTRTTFFAVDVLEREFLNQTGNGKLGLAIVTDQRLADLIITIDRPLFTYTFTYTVTDARTSVLLDTGKVTAIDGNSAAGRIATDVTARLATLRQDSK
jgi:hypothetical protein